MCAPARRTQGAARARPAITYRARSGPRARNNAPPVGTRAPGPVNKWSPRGRRPGMKSLAAEQVQHCAGPTSLWRAIANCGPRAGNPPDEQIAMANLVLAPLNRPIQAQHESAPTTRARPGAPLGTPAGAGRLDTTHADSRAAQNERAE